MHLFFNVGLVAYFLFFMKGLYFAKIFVTSDSQIKMKIQYHCQELFYKDYKISYK